MTRAVVVHGHFYQPPRENPWLEAVEVQDSAAPYHDWNERVTAECYAPNTAARRVDGDNRVLDIVNNFEKISFDVGPTLAAWLARGRPDVWSRIAEADRASVRARGGHGNAIAQAYHHAILPLASRRDKVTEVRWGLEDFRARFGRDPEGLWLPETAVDGETLEVLAEAGLKFTILAPHQARWPVDPRSVYLWRGPRGLRLALFFYDADISRGIAFETLLERSESLVARLGDAFAPEAAPQLVQVATDGESYGHHRTFGEMALAAAVQALEAEGTLLTNYGAWLAAHPPTEAVEIEEGTSWSCAHGIERWRSDCGCRLREGSHQRWRGPLREALDWLRDQIDVFYEARASAHLKDPWAARDAYIAVILDRSPARLNAFLAAHQRVPLDPAARYEVRRLLELQRNRLLMYTSCGWFFDDIGGLETAQIMRYAAMAVQYLAGLGGGDLEDELRRRLAAAPGNRPELADGADVYARLVRPTVADARRVVAHHAIAGLFEERPAGAAVGAWQVEPIEQVGDTYDGTMVRLAHVWVTSEVSGERGEFTSALLHFGGHDVLCAIREWTGRAAWQVLTAELLPRGVLPGVADLVRRLDAEFPGEHYTLAHLFVDERRRVLARLIQATLDRQEAAFQRVWEESRALLHYLRAIDIPIPEPLALVARHVLERQIREDLETMPVPGPLPARVVDAAAEARALGLGLDLTPVRPAMIRAVQAALDAVAAERSPARAAAAVVLLEGARRLGLRYGHWAAQNRFFEIWRAHADARPTLAALGDTLGFKVVP